MNIVLACDHEEGQQFADWLNVQGYSAQVGNDTRNHFEGWSDESPTLGQLWRQYCDQPKIPGSIISDVQYDGRVTGAAEAAGEEFEVAKLVTDLEKIWGDQ